VQSRLPEIYIVIGRTLRHLSLPFRPEKHFNGSLTWYDRKIHMLESTLERTDPTASLHPSLSLLLFSKLLSALVRFPSIPLLLLLPTKTDRFSRYSPNHAQMSITSARGTSTSTRPRPSTLPPQLSILQYVKHYHILYPPRRPSFP
jgi:hypothetical protein